MTTSTRTSRAFFCLGGGRQAVETTLAANSLGVGAYLQSSWGVSNHESAESVWVYCLRCIRSLLLVDFIFQLISVNWNGGLWGRIPCVDSVFERFRPAFSSANLWQDLGRSSARATEEEATLVLKWKWIWNDIVFPTISGTCCDGQSLLFPLDCKCWIQESGGGGGCGREARYLLLTRDRLIVFPEKPGRRLTHWPELQESTTCLIFRTGHGTLVWGASSGVCNKLLDRPQDTARPALRRNVTSTPPIQWIEKYKKVTAISRCFWNLMLGRFDEALIANWIARLDRAASEAARQVQDAAERGETFLPAVDGKWGRQPGTWVLRFLWGEEKRFPAFPNFLFLLLLFACSSPLFWSLCSWYLLFPIFGFGFGWSWINAIRSFGCLPRNLMIRVARPPVICWLSLSLSMCCSIRRAFVAAISFLQGPVWQKMPHVLCRGACRFVCVTYHFTVHNPYGIESIDTEILAGHSKGRQICGNSK